MDKNKYIPLDLTLNGKHENLETLSDAMNSIHENLTMLKEYPKGVDWGIVDIATISEPQVVGRSEENLWLMASNLSIRIQTEKE
jgi:predicted translin family RNA/ssDNA-binding protein